MWCGNMCLKKSKLDSCPGSQGMEAQRVQRLLGRVALSTCSPSTARLRLIASAWFMFYGWLPITKQLQPVSDVGNLSLFGLTFVERVAQLK
jgi:hypothetical protein